MKVVSMLILDASQGACIKQANKEIHNYACDKYSEGAKKEVTGDQEHAPRR